jgi:hypothetical protein
VPDERTANVASVIPFDVNAEKLPPNYGGADIAKLFSIYARKAPLKKGEFETTHEYEEKVASAVTNSVYAFRLGNDNDMFSPDASTIHPYDADTQRLQIDLSTTHLNEYHVGDDRAAFIIKTVSQDSGAYVGSNVFGASRLVKSYSVSQYGIALVNQSEFGFSRYSDTDNDSPLSSERRLHIQIVVPPERARKLKNNIGILILCKPTLYKSDITKEFKNGNDLIFEDFSYEGATIYSPISVIYYKSFINVDVLAIWVYEITTGNVLYKYDINAQRGITGKESAIIRDFSSLIQCKEHCDKFKVKEIDLNNDGIKEYIVTGDYGYWCGAANCRHWVLQKYNDKLRIILDDYPAVAIEPLESRTNGYRDLAVTYHFSAAEEPTFRLRWDGHKYVNADVVTNTNKQRESENGKEGFYEYVNAEKGFSVRIPEPWLRMENFKNFALMAIEPSGTTGEFFGVEVQNLPGEPSQELQDQLFASAIEAMKQDSAIVSDIGHAFVDHVQARTYSFTFGNANSRIKGTMFQAIRGKRCYNIGYGARVDVIHEQKESLESILKSLRFR